MGRDDVTERAETRAELLPEEQAADSDDPRGQAFEVLRDSENRTKSPEPREQRRPEETA